MAILKSSIPYAKALFDLAKDKNLLTDIKTDMSSLLDAVNNSPEFKDLISNPTMNKTSKIELFSKLFSGKLKAETSSFLTLLITKGRMAELGSVCESYIHMVNTESNTVLVKLTTASQITDEAKNQIASKALGTAKYEVETIVNPDIIGGYILEFDNKMIDQSLSTKINIIKKDLTK